MKLIDKAVDWARKWLRSEGHEGKVTNGEAVRIYRRAQRRRLLRRKAERLVARAERRRRMRNLPRKPKR